MSLQNIDIIKIYQSEFYSHCINKYCIVYVTGKRNFIISLRAHITTFMIVI